MWELADTIIVNRLALLAAFVSLNTEAEYVNVLGVQRVEAA